MKIQLVAGRQLDLVMIETCIARADQRELDAMEKIWADLRDDPDHFLQYHRRFHQILPEAIRNRDFSNTRQLVDRHLGGLCSKYQVFPYASESKSSSPGAGD